MKTSIGYVIRERVGPSIYEAHTIPFVYLKREWAEYQKEQLDSVLDEPGVALEIQQVTIVEEGPTK